MITSAAYSFPGAGNVKITRYNSGSYYQGIKNPDATYGINVLIEVVALVASDGYVTEQNQFNPSKK